MPLFPRLLVALPLVAAGSFSLIMVGECRLYGEGAFSWSRLRHASPKLADDIVSGHENGSRI